MDSQTTYIGIGQILSGVINLIIMSLGWFFLGSTVGGTVTAVFCGVVTLGICPLPFGALCGFVGILPIFLGLLEIISGILILMDADRYRTFARAIGIVEVMSILYGGICSVLVGVFTLFTLKSGAATDEF